MIRLLGAIQSIAVTLWVGALWTTGLLTAPLLFEMVPERTLAGTVAGRLFETVAFIGLACGAFILLICWLRRRLRAPLHYHVVWLVLAMVVITLIGQFAIQPVLAALREQVHPQPVMQSAFSGSFAAWHAAAGILYVVQCLLGAGLVISNRVNGVDTVQD